VPWVRNGTVLENIVLYGELDHARLEEAIRDACLEQDIALWSKSGPASEQIRPPQNRSTRLRTDPPASERIHPLRVCACAPACLGSQASSLTAC
jgi:hypothetical protein